MAVVSPPAMRGGLPPWSQVEATLGTSLPADYKALIERYGPGAWDDFLHVFQPSHPNHHIDLVAQGELRAEVYEVLVRGGEQMPVPVQELLVVAGTDNGDTVFWHRSPGSAPDSWPIIVNEARGPDWVQYPGPFVSFLTDVLTGTFGCDVFPRGFPSAAPRFVAYS